MADRHSEIDEPDLITDPDAKALAEARNALRQFDIGMVLLDHWLDNGGAPPNLRISDLLALNRFALEDVNKYAGTFRTQPVKIQGSDHVPPAASQVPTLTEDFCDYINQNWNKKSAIHLSAYALWRINWIHPFVDGNGRTARIISYIILCAKFGYRIPGTKTIPEQIAANKLPYYQALESADRIFNYGHGWMNVSAVENLIEGSLRNQIEDVMKFDRSNKSSARTIDRPVLEGELLVADITRADKIVLTLRMEDAQPRKNLLSKVQSCGRVCLQSLLL
jgi:Fic family protein